MPSPGQFHPEFGYVCPTPRFRRMFSVGFVACAVGMLVGAVGIIALAQRPEMQRIRGEVASTVGLSESRAAAPAAAPMRAPDWPRANAASVPAAAGGAPCAAQSWPPRDDKCLLGTQRKVVTLPDSFEAAPAPGPALVAPASAIAEPSQEAASAKAAEPAARATAAAPVVRKRPKVVHRREQRAPERYAMPERPQVEARGVFGGGPLTHDQWRYDHAQQWRDGRGWSW